MANVYTTVQGDKWDLIAHQQLGDTAHMSKLMAENPHYLDYYIFPSGIELQLPDLTLEQSAMGVLPPWRQGL